jgi:NAD(P)-dependent dehydrogenase (short-subunit alcohol dehydrogenase family)
LVLRARPFSSLGLPRGIGRAAAELVVARGAHLIALDIDLPGLESLQSDLALTQDQIHEIDLSNETSVRSKIEEISFITGKIDALINTAGIVGPSNTNVEEVAWPDYERTVRVNLFGAIWLTQAVIPKMKERRYGRIVHVASIAGKEGNPGMSAYNVSKAGMIGFVKGVAKEVATHGITINCVAPAVIRTPMNVDTSDDALKYMISRIPMGRVGESEEVAELLAFISSKACSFTTGFTFDVSGGRATY